MQEPILSRTEATMLARYLKEKDIDADWVDLFRLSVSAAALKYGLTIEQVNQAIRRITV